MTDKQFTKRLAKLNSMLYNCIGEAEILLNEKQANQILDSSDDERIIQLKNLYNSYSDDGICDCDIHGATLSDITLLVSRLYDEGTTEGR